MANNSRTRRPNTVTAFVEDGTSKYAMEAVDYDTAVATFLYDCTVKNLSSFTVKYYRNSLKELVKYLLIAKAERPIDVTEALLKTAIMAKLNSGVKDTTVNTNLKGWRTFFRFLNERSFLPTNPAEHVELLRTERRIIPAFTTDQVKALLKAADQQSFTGFRDYTTVQLLIETGIRICELEGLKVTDIYWKERVIKVFGKGRKERFVPFQATLEKQMKKYVAIRGPLDHDFLFVNIDNSAIKRRTVQENIQKLGIAAGIKGVRVSPHTFRHTFAKFYIMNGGDAFSLQKMLGHTTVEMVQTYVSLFGADIAKQHRKFSPLEHLHDDDND
ncbi:tyrosine-type recombinase/integrase [Paenibacillus agricola]|uniref:Tyrosine-type recombinase/integrase n=1 Tax=Paenibacillus agricola TaxID=2716264 RepID=A0ABX0J8K9_9BACL|nr:tyrosine-type recombinase/integrase [Paenibacillus agricola]NHN31197.1 tyrosine-type recombinase/integrase [Paenibacillus agricola]